ncbi:2-amino-4-hydroxy-6-hydroxymethyldihydropteridine diphosphokinase [Streptococcus ovuberis]|uniref:2-amino-4-hydroxy-6-hydroxymethyldihydropteridine diphosphokinase n=1 Tax=Streptococcus ovuberis TaxID=1936207 RepID=A0A7X6MYT8_9STRE|nr:2-amino-4-hydroxy-6-hydroxymethyldihydropteridine diphosphokinase [Streptococcus ovuberis]NKZ20935.1 2-amino-4-hydroxy-6-hydroxymethyldihydropteridine diphosphokinase [Streptococcus ovuberis]
MSQVFLSLGSNMGNRASYLDQAVQGLKQLPATQLLAISPIYETNAWGKTDQADFLNLCLAIDTDLSPQDLLHHTQALELSLGRERHEHWGPRTVDIDILLYGQDVVQEENLTLPHPLMQERAFVLVPLADIAPTIQHPIFLKSIAELLEEVNAEGVRAVNQ